ncbi:glycosyl transferase [Ruegeria sp. ANG-S4]|uniref:glycosyltransferase n=1 Tax=Ruegeria sp. ANG-S4 TaxID=1577904 RepID=UPI0005803B6B|nr:glycosyltransferase [Ruegeria sp. ANG-S4]KIC45533.1 glycosyl transferase [Ruegeria sp. ANG-S4]
MPSANSAADALSIIIAAHNEELYIGPCLEALLKQQGVIASLTVIVAANACTDQTEDLARGYSGRFADRGWGLTILSIAQAGKANALNCADQVAMDTARIYLDADVICSPELLGQLQEALGIAEPTYATGTIHVMRAQSWVTRAYARFWVRLPFVQDGAVGAGLFAVNVAGRKRWGEFPSIISDDTFVRLTFAPHERIEVEAAYEWPMVEGFTNLVRVRRRQDAGVDEVNRLYPALMQNDQKGSLSKSDLLKLFLQQPFNCAVYLCVHLAVRLRRGGDEWTRGR